MNGIGPASLTSWLIESLTPGSIERTLRHIATGWLTLASAEAVCIWWQSRPSTPSIAFAASDGNSAFADPMPLADDDFTPILEWAANSTSAPIDSLQLQVAADSPVRFRLFAGLSDPKAQLPEELETATHRLLERLESEAMIEERLLHSKLEAMAEFAAGAGHEINNPVATIVGRTNLLLAEEPDLGRRASLATIGAQALRIRDMIGDAMLFARPPKPHLQTLDLKTVLPEIVAPYESRYRAKKVTLTQNPIPSLMVSADRTQLAVVISGLLQNALDATPPDGNVELAVEPLTPSLARIEITDSGTGLSETDRLHLFDPFYSGRQAGRGLGFGLSKAWRIVTQHGGRIAMEDSASGGCRCLVDWPTPTD